MVLLTPVQQLSGIGVAAQDGLAAAGIVTLWDLLLHLPLRYENRTQLTPAATLSVGQLVQLEGMIARSQELLMRRPVHLLTLQSDHVLLQLRFLNYQKWSHTLPKVGSRVRVFGVLRQDMNGALELLHPSMTRLDTKDVPLPTHLTPVYPNIAHIKQGALRTIILNALALLKQAPPEEWLPPSPYAQISLWQSLQTIHAPHPNDEAALLSGYHPAIQRLALEELIAQQLLLLTSRDVFARSRAPALRSSRQLDQQLLAHVPFTPTQGQQLSWQAIQADLVQTSPMHRLLQGDVGSGKTLLAALAAVQCCDAGYQVSVMAPTSILAEQLFETLSTWLTPLQITVQLFTSQMKAADRRRALMGIADGHIQVVVGTHALFQEEVSYAKLGLVIVDEQHRFGVEQRLALKAKGQQDAIVPHVLLMTATPIPRTLAMTVYGDLSITSLTERPAGRQQIDTVVISDARRIEVADRLAKACQQGAQAYWVSPFIEMSETVDAHNVTDTEKWLTARYPALRVGVVHGRLSAKDKERYMQTFKAGLLDVLVATTVIEVGVNVPNASLMVIDNSERYGLAQLHQLRGRVGRGDAKSSCVLLYQSPLSEMGKARLMAIRDRQDGFWLAEQDLLLRGPGEVLGTRQTGLSEWRIADLIRDTQLHEPARSFARQVYEQTPRLAPAIIQRWLGHRLRFVQA